jgi:hypothetical protein
MGAVFVLLIVVAASMLCVRAGAIALELTGMAQEKARFQSLSAFTNTGFTTRETEEITRFPARRRIVSILIVVGYAGTVSVIAALATSLLQRDVEGLARNVAIIVVALFLLQRLASVRRLTGGIGGALRRWLLARYDLRAPSLEEMLRVAEGFGVVRTTVPEGSPLAGRPLVDIGLKARKVQILAITRGETTILVPSGADALLPGDVLICYGDEAATMEVFAARAAAPSQPEE